jgi:hypothetical protein
MKHIQGYNERFNVLDLPRQLYRLIKKIGDFSLISKVKGCLVNLKGKNAEEAYEYMCQVFGKRPDKGNFMELANLEYVTVNESFLDRPVNTITKILFWVGLFLIAAFLRMGLENSYKDDTIDFLKSEQIENIKITGSDPFAERKDDVIGLTFTGERDGRPVSGVVIVGGSSWSDQGNTYQIKYYNN